jgi:putative DNA primase/helicase
MSRRDWQAFDAEVRARAPELAIELMGKPTFRADQEWRWGRKGSLSVVIAGARAGIWFDHEAGEGGGLVSLVARIRGLTRSEALDWTADRIGRAGDFEMRPYSAKPVTRPAAGNVFKPRDASVDVAARGAASSKPEPVVASHPAEAATRAARIWATARPAPDDHPYLTRKQVRPLGLRADARGHLVVPLQDADGRLHSLETIAPDGAKRFLAGGAKRGHFCVIGADPAAIAEPSGPILICEGWATAASLQLATGHTVIAAMDAGNLLPVSEALRSRFAHADLVLVADNDAKPGRDANPGVEAARKAALAVDGRLAVPTVPGDANDVFCAEGAEAVAAIVERAVKIPTQPPTYPAPMMTPDEARAVLSDAISRFMAAVPEYWAAVEAAREAPENGAENRYLLDFNIVERTTMPPLLGLPVDVGIGKTSSARAAIARLVASGGLGDRKVVYAVPRHDLGAEQVAAFEALGLRAMLWRGRTAPDPAPENPDRLMCLDSEATFDALEIEHPVEQSCCKLKRGSELHLCAYYSTCGYQRQKPHAQAAEVIVCAHDSLFHMKPEAIGTVGLLVIDEAFWQSGLRGLDGKATLTQDGLEPGRASLVCYGAKGKVDMSATADLVAARARLWKALQVAEPGPLNHGLLAAVGLTPEDCRQAATLERRRLRDAGLLPGMSPALRRKRVEAVLPPAGEPWAPPGRCATLWLILAEALETGHDAAGADLVNEHTENGSVRALKLRWRSKMRAGWAAETPILHLDATLRPELVQTYLPLIDIGAPVAARQPHVRIRQVTGSPTSARALIPGPDALERDRKAATSRLRDLAAWIALRARQCRRRNARADLLVVGQKVAIDALRAAGLPPRVDAVHFNALSGLDRWGDIGGMIVLGRTLPAPRAVELIAMALTGRVPAPNPEDAGWWYPTVERRHRLADDRTVPLAMEVHADLIAEAVRWSICEGELIQAIGRGRGVNRSADSVLEIDLLTDVVLPVTVNTLVPWSDLKPTRRDMMALSGIVLENATDMAVCFPELWPTAEAAKKDGQRKGTNDYYRDLYNSRMSPSSAEVTYHPTGPGHRARTAQVDLTRIPDPEAWLTNRLGPLARFEIRLSPGTPPDEADRSDVEGLDALAFRRSASMHGGLATPRPAPAARAALEAATSTLPHPSSSTTQPKEAHL